MNKEQRESYKRLVEGCPGDKCIVSDGSGWYRYEAVAKPTFEEQKTLACSVLWSNYKAHQTKYMDAEDLTLAAECARTGSAKGMAMQRWVLDLWLRYYEVKDRITASVTAEALAEIELSATSFGAPPYTVRELNDEAAEACAIKN